MISLGFCPGLAPLLLGLHGLHGAVCVGMSSEKVWGLQDTDVLILRSHDTFMRHFNDTFMWSQY